MNEKKIILLFIFLALIDRALKIATLLYFTETKIMQPKQLLGNFFSWVYFKNDKMAFSLPFINQTIIITITFFLILILLYLFIKSFRTQKLYHTYSYALIIIGACSNFYDRLFYHSVIDYFFLYPISYFNIADLLIGAGIIWLGVLLFKK